MIEFSVLGCGKSVLQFVPNATKTIGVNDIWRYWPVNYLVILDRPDNFTPDRLRVIRNSKPEIFFSTIDEWNENFEQFSKLHVTDNEGGNINYLNHEKFIPYHVDSTFTAVCLAYRMGASKIVLYGADFTAHHLFKTYKNEILQAYKNLYKTLLLNKCELFVYNQSSELSKVLPFLKHNL